MIFETSLALQMIETDRDGLEKTLRRLQDIENLVEKLATDICTIRFAPLIHTAKKKTEREMKIKQHGKEHTTKCTFSLETLRNSFMKSGVHAGTGSRESSIPCLGVYLHQV